MARSRRSKDAPSESFPGFTDVDEVGSGSIATVYRAQAQGIGVVALKLVTAPTVDPTLVAAAERELAELGSLASHPNVVTLFRNFRLDDGRLVLVLELCRGSLRDQVDGGRGLPVADVVAAGAKIAGALDAAHRLGLLHRDVSPGNILVTADGEPALADLGLAGLRPPGIPSLDGAVHTAPELLDRAAATPASDVYGLASSMYQLIAGHPAFAARAGESPAAMVLRVQRETPPPLQAARPAVAALLARAMAKDPASRPATAAAFAAELAAVTPRATALRADLPPQPAPPKVGSDDWSAPTLSRPEPVPPPPVPAQPPAEQTVRRSMLPPEFLTPGPSTSGPSTSGPSTPGPQAADPAAQATPPAQLDDIEAAAMAEMEAAARADMAQATAGDTSEPEPASPPEPPPPAPRPEPVRIPEPPPPAEATVRRSTLPRLPEPPPSSGATVARGSLAGVPQAPPAARPSRPPAASPSAAEQTVFRSRPPQLPPAPSPEVTVRRSALPIAPSYYPNAGPPPPSPPPAVAGPVALDPTVLARRVTLRSGRASMLVDETGLTLRALLRKKPIPWAEISGFEARYEDPANPMTGGHLVAMTRSGPVDLPATRRAMADLRYTQALLEAYRLRAQTPPGY